LTGRGAPTNASPCRRARRVLATSVMLSKSSHPSRWIQRRTWRARNGFSPRSANQATRPSASKSRRLNGALMRIPR